MRRMRGYPEDFDDDVDVMEVRGKRARGRPESMEAARDAWEPIVCPRCGADHTDMTRVRLRRTTGGIEARCGYCGAVAARYAAGVWTS